MPCSESAGSELQLSPGLRSSSSTMLAGNAVSRATAFAAMDGDFELNVDTRDLLETAGFLLYVSNRPIRIPPLS